MSRFLQGAVLCFALASTLGAQETEEAVKVFRDVQAGVVSLENLEGSGTGIILDKNGLILTNAHVIASPLPFRCRVDAKLRGDSQTFVYEDVKIVGVHPVLDLALVRVNPAEHKGVLQPVMIAKSKGTTGQRVYAIGNPSGGGGIVLSKTITGGMLSGVDRIVEDVAYYQISAPINPGNSGGPLCDRAGNVLGLVTLKFTDVENIGFAIPLQGLTFNGFIPLAERKPEPAKALKAAEIAQAIFEQSKKVAGQKGTNNPEAQKLAALSMNFYRIALSYDPGSAGLYYNVGMLLRGLDHDEVAVAYLLQAIRIAPWPQRDGYFYYHELGFALVKQKKLQQALAAYQEGISKYPVEGAKIWEDLALYWMNEGPDFYQAALAASTVLHIKDPQTRQGVASEIRKEALGRLSPEDRTRLDQAVSQLDRDLAERKKSSEKALRARKAVMTEAFASFFGNNADSKKTASDKVTLSTTTSGATTSEASEASVEKKAALDLSVPAGSINVLADIDVAQDAVEGRWSFSDLALGTPILPFAKLQPRVKLPAEYDLTLIVERRGGVQELAIGFVRGGVQSAFFVDAHLGKKSGLDPAAEGAYSGALLPRNEPGTIVLKVRREGLLVTVNGNRVFFQRSEKPFGAVSEKWSVPDSTGMFLGSNTSKFLIHKLVVTEYKRGG